MFSSALDSQFDCLLAGLLKNCSTDFQIIQWKGPQNKPLDLGCNPDHVTLGLRLGRVTMTVSVHRDRHRNPT